MSTEKEDVSAHRAVAEEVSKRAQKQLRDLREELAEAQKKEIEASQKYKERVSPGNSACKSPKCLFSFLPTAVCLYPYEREISLKILNSLLSSRL